MRYLYAVQFEVASLKSDVTLDVAEETLRAVDSWISEWYLFRKSIKIEFPAAGGNLNPCRSHELTVSRGISQAGKVSHSTVSWSYPDENDGNLLWHSQCEVSKFGDLTEFSFQLLLESLQFYIAPVEFVLQRPRLIATLLRQFVCTHGDERLSTEPRILSAQGVPEFVQTHLLSRSRRVPIVVVSRTPISEKWLVDPEELADRLAGIAEVRILDDQWAGYALSDEVGKIYSCYNGAVRLYWPDFDPEASCYSPVYTPDKVRDLGGRLVEIIFRQLAAISAFRFVPGPVAVDALDFLGEQKRKELESIKKAAQERGDYEQFVKMWEAENVELKEKLRQSEEENADLRAGLQLSHDNLRAIWRAQEVEGIGTAEPLPEEEVEPESIEDAVRMAQSNFSETLVFLESAITSAKDSPFKQSKRVSQALLAMHEVCREWRKSRKEKAAIGLIENHFAVKGFKYKPRESMTSKGKWTSEYEAMYRGGKVPIEQHLAIGKGGPDSCLRIHFYTDDEEQKYVIAHVGRHKTNTSA
jgi:hypothetical protein